MKFVRRIFFPIMITAVIVTLAYFIGKSLPVLPFALNRWITCDEFEVHDYNSTSGEFVATVFVVKCNNENPTTFVALRKSSERQNLSDRDKAVFGLANSTTVGVYWKNESTLNVYYWGGKPGKTKKKHLGISIEVIPLRPD